MATMATLPTLSSRGEPVFSLTHRLLPHICQAPISPTHRVPDTRYLSSAVDLSALQPASEAFRSFLSRCFIRETDAGEGVNRQEAPGVNPVGGEEKLRLILFTGAPRAYVMRLLDALGLGPLFDEGVGTTRTLPRRVLTAEDLLPNCKPERLAFETVLMKNQVDGLINRTEPLIPP